MIAQDTIDETIVVTSRPAPVRRAKPKQQPLYAVIVENDDFHTFTYVTEALSKICGFNRQKAFLLACEIDGQGEALVWSGSLEVAELKRDQIRGYGTDYYAPKPVTFPLGVRIEPLP